MTYFEFLESIEHLSKKDVFTRDDMLDILDYISLSFGSVFDFNEFNDSDFYFKNFKRIFDDLMIRFGPRSADE